MGEKQIFFFQAIKLQTLGSITLVNNACTCMNYQIKIMDYWLFYIKISAFTFLFQINIAEYNNDWIINANFSLLGTKLNIKLKTLGESKETTEENKFYILIPVDTRDGGAWWAAISGVAQSRTRLKQLSSSSSRDTFACFLKR